MDDPARQTPELAGGQLPHTEPAPDPSITPETAKQHRTLGTLLNILIDTGFLLAQIEDWGPTEAQVADWPKLAAPNAPRSYWFRRSATCDGSWHIRRICSSDVTMSRAILLWSSDHDTGSFIHNV